MDFCPKCHLVVAPFEPGKKIVGLAVFHGACWRTFTPWQRERIEATAPHHKHPRREEPRAGRRPD